MPAHTRRRLNVAGTKAPSSTRDAVETAIDLSKGDKSSTWEGRLERSKKITPWLLDEDSTENGGSEPANKQ